MKYFTIIVLMLCLALSCSNPVNKKVASSDSSNTIAASNTPIAHISNDSITTRQTSLYWEKLPTRQVAELILKDSIRPLSNPVIYRMLDSLTSEFEETRRFYFRVFNKIMNTADGEVAESIGGYALTYVQNYPKEFLDNTRSFSNNSIEAWASNIGIELFLASNDNVKEAFDQVVILFNDNCKNCNAHYKNRLKDFTKMIWRTIQENLQAQK